MTGFKRVAGVLLVAVSVLATGIAIAKNDDHHGRSDKRAEKMQMRMDKHLGELKSKLAITAAQEGAWQDFQNAMKPPATNNASKSDKRQAMASMTTPQRLEARSAMQAARMAEMKARTDAITTFYAALTPVQQASFDTESVKFMGDGHGKGGKGGKGHGDKHDDAH